MHKKDNFHAATTFSNLTKFSLSDDEIQRIQGRGYEWKKIEQNEADDISRMDWTGLDLSVEHDLECKYRFWNYFWDEIIICSPKNDHFRPIILAFSSAV